MARKKIERKNKSISISLLHDQVKFVKSHKKFDLSKFVQIHLADHISLTEELEAIKKEVQKND